MKYIITYTTGNKKQFPITRFIKQKHHLLPKANKMFLVSCVICICLMLSVTAVMPSSVQTADAKAVNADMADEKTGSAWLTCRQVTVAKGQYAFIGLNGINAQTNVKWTVPEGKINLDRKGRLDDDKAYCYIKALKTGTWTLKCRADKKVLKCRVKVLPEAGFIGCFCDDAKEVYINISKNDKKYVAQYKNFKACSIDNLKGSIKNGVLVLETNFPLDKEVLIHISHKQNNLVLEFKKIKHKRLKEGSAITLKKCNGEDGYMEALNGTHLLDTSYLPSSTMPVKYAKPGNTRFTCRQVTVVKGQYAFVAIRGIKEEGRVKWIIPEGKLKLDRKGRYDDERAYCYIKTLKAGTWTLKCKVNKKVLKCRVKVLPEAGFIGCFCDDAKEVYLDISKNDKKYVAQYGQFRLCSISNLKGNVKNGMLVLKGNFPGETEILINISRKGKNLVLEFKKIDFGYIKEGSTITLKKCSGKDGYGQALYGVDLEYSSYI